MTMIDNRMGFGAGGSNPGDEYKEVRIELNKNIIYGESEIPDCPDDKSFCYIEDKMGVMLAGPTTGGRAQHITGSSALPYHHQMSIGLWGGS